jgi:hypothetical protein
MYLFVCIKVASSDRFVPYTENPAGFGVQIQVPMVRKATQAAVESTRKELRETLEAVRLAQMQLEQLQREQAKDEVSISSCLLEECA